MPEQAERKRDERPRRPVLRVLGIDPGSRFTGFGLLAVEGNRMASAYQVPVDEAFKA